MTSLPDDFQLFIQNPKAVQSIKLAGWNRTSVYVKRNHSRVFSPKANQNPFNPGVILHLYWLNSDIEISLFDISGKLVHFIRNSNTKESIVYWEPKNIASGTYFVRLYDGRNSQNTKLSSKMITRFLVILILFSQSYGDTTIVAFDAVHQSFRDLGNNRSITQLIQFPNLNSNYSDVIMLFH